MVLILTAIRVEQRTSLFQSVCVDLKSSDPGKARTTCQFCCQQKTTVPGTSSPALHFGVRGISQCTKIVSFQRNSDSAGSQSTMKTFRELEASFQLQVLLCVTEKAEDG